MDMKKYQFSEVELVKRLQRPQGKIDVVLDTDTYNEIDDQFAMAYLIKSSDKLNLEAIYAAPFHNAHSDSPEDGMEKSFDEIHKVLTLMDREDYKKVVFKGSRTYLPNEDEYVDSPAARDLVERAMARDDDKPLYVVAIGAITNIASAILMKPEIIRKIVIVWLGGNSINCDNNFEFNSMQDVAASRIIFGCGVPLVQLPCWEVVSVFRTTGPELEYWLKDKNKLCDYLVQNTIEEAERFEKSKCWSRVIWDVTAIGWLLNDKGQFMDDRLEHSPIPGYDGRWSRDLSRHLIRYVYNVRRDELFSDLFDTLSRN